MKSASAIALLLLSACATPPVSGTDAAPAIDQARLAEHVRVLAPDEFEGRGPGTAGETKTVAYISEQFRQAGLEPGGPNGSWTQDVPLVQSEITGTPQLAFTVGGTRQAVTQGRSSSSATA